MKHDLIYLLSGYMIFTLFLTSCISMTDDTVSLDDGVTEEVQNIHDNLLITANASKLVLSSSDVRPGWVRSADRMTDGRDTESACSVSFQYNIGVPPLNMSNRVAVYPDVDTAEQAYEKIAYQDDSVDNCDIGDECLLDVSTEKNTFLLFRENNVIVQLWINEDRFNEVTTYANIIEKRMGDCVQIEEETSESN